jgi:hypothetical protein
MNTIIIQKIFKNVIDGNKIEVESMVREPLNTDICRNNPQ